MEDGRDIVAKRVLFIKDIKIETPPFFLFSGKSNYYSVSGAKCDQARFSSLSCFEQTRRGVVRNLRENRNVLLTAKNCVFLCVWVCARMWQAFPCRGNLARKKKSDC